MKQQIQQNDLDPKKIINLRLTLFTSITFLCLIGCSDRKVKPIVLDQTKLKKEWISDNKGPLFIEDSLLLHSDLFKRGSPVSRYALSNDTLTIYREFDSYKKNIYTVKYKIIKLDSTNLVFKDVSGRDTSLWKFKKMDVTKKNNLSVCSLELSFSCCSWSGRYFDLKITDDSAFYFHGYYNPNQMGLYKHKLTDKEFQKIQCKLNAIEIDSFFFSGYVSDAGEYSLFIKTPMKPIDIHGTRTGKVSLRFRLFLYYLESLDLLLPWEKSDENIQFRDKSNKQREERRQNRY